MEKSFKVFIACQTKKRQWIIYDSNNECLKLPGTALIAGDTEVNETDSLNSQSSYFGEEGRKWRRQDIYNYYASEYNICEVKPQNRMECDEEITCILDCQVISFTGEIWKLLKWY